MLGDGVSMPAVFVRQAGGGVSGDDMVWTTIVWCRDRIAGDTHDEASSSGPNVVGPSPVKLLRDALSWSAAIGVVLCYSGSVAGRWLAGP